MSENSTKDKNKGLIYHYTDQIGLTGILKSDCIWATHYRFLNDTSERKGAVDFFVAFEQLKSEGTQLSTQFGKELRESLEQMLDNVDAYIVSFSEQGDDPQFAGDRLSQWRGYAINRQGYSLGFETNDLIYKTTQWTNDMQLATLLFSCVYEKECKSNKVKNIISQHGEELKRISLARSKTNRNESEQIIENPMSKEEFLNLLMSFLQFSSEFKNDGFKEELEQRLVVYALDRAPRHAKIEFRDSAFGRSPYIEIPLGLKNQDSALKRIVVGPSQNKDQIVDTLSWELATMGIQGVDVVPSKIPYRNW